MKSLLFRTAILLTLTFPRPSSADTITRHQLLTTCEAKAQKVAYVHRGLETGVPKNTLLAQINEGVVDEDATSQNRKLVHDVYTSPRPVGSHDWNDETMQSCIASLKSRLPMEDSGPLLLWRVVKNWDRTAAAIGRQGTVGLEVVIKADSTVGNVKVVSSSGFENLDNAAVDEVRHWQWRAVVRDGKFYPASIKMSLVSSDPSRGAHQEP